MQAMPIKARAKVQTIVRVGTDANRPAMMAALGSHHANKPTRLLPTPVFGAWIGLRSAAGLHALLNWWTRHRPVGANTQQEPGNGLSVAPQPLQSYTDTQAPVGIVSVA